MKTCAYDELYLPLAQRVMGDMYDYAVNTLHYAIAEFHRMFIASGMAHQFENGNPTYIAGKNGCEVAKEVITDCGIERPNNEDIMYLDKSQEYWIGWTLAYYQWKSGYKYADIDKCVPIEEMYKMYGTFHEADLSLVVEAMDARNSGYMAESRLKRLRKYVNLSQSNLAQKSGVPLRQIQLFEQGYRDINKTQVETMNKLAQTLHCDIRELMQ